MSLWFDVVVIGGGVVGCAVLRALALKGRNCVLLEKNRQVANGASGGNSGLLHTGFDSTKGTLEATLMKKGFQKLRTLINNAGLPVQHTGAILVAWTEEELQALPSIVQNAHDNDVTDARQISLQELYEREPHLNKNALGGILIPGEASVDPWLIPMLYLNQALSNGAKLKLQFEVVFGRFDDTHKWKLQSKTGEVIRCGTVINCAGLYGDVVEQINKTPNFTIRPRQGQFVIYSPVSSLLNSMILPIPTKRTKGIFVFKSVYNQIVIGPTAEDVKDRESGKTDTETIQRLVKKGEEVFPLLKTLTPLATYAGLRPATEFSDYQIKPQPDKMWITVAGIRSTGLTASLAIADYVEDIFSNNFISKETNQQHHQQQKSQNDIELEAKQIALELIHRSVKADWNKAIPHPLHKYHYITPPQPPSPGSRSNL